MPAEFHQPTASEREDNLSPWIVIPARGGSVGVPRKNVRMIAGRPLIAYAIDTSLEVVPSERLVVITDDEEIADVSRAAGAQVIIEKVPTPAHETLDEKISRNLPRLGQLGAAVDDVIITLQPTSPLLRPETIRDAVSALLGGAKSAITVTDDRHLRWTMGEDGGAQPLYERRLNRQQLPPLMRETGGIIACRYRDIARTRSRVIPPVALVPVDSGEAVDIDTFEDLYSAAHLLTRLKIALRADAGKNRGMGHIYRTLAFASELARHDIRIYTSRDSTLAQTFFSRYPFPVHPITTEDQFLQDLHDWQPDLVVLDVLDTQSDYIRAIRSHNATGKILTIEDLGDGAGEADAVLSEFVKHPTVPDNKQLFGVENSILAPAFETMPIVSQFRPEVEHVLVLFGGTDPSNLAEKAVASLGRVEFKGKITVVRGLGAEPYPRPTPSNVRVLTNVKNMPALMASADLAYTSAGRTIVELASAGVPSICMAQNHKELTHLHANIHLGVRMLGHGLEVLDEELDAATAELLQTPHIRRLYHSSALTTLQNRSNHKTLGRLLDMLGFDPFPNL